MSPSNRRIPDLTLERYLADALDAEARSHVEALLAASPADAQRLAELRADSEAMLQRHPPEAMVARLRARAAGRSDSSVLVGVLTRMTLTEAQRPEAPYISDGFMEFCLRSQQAPAHAPQHPGFHSPGEALITRFIVALNNLLARALADPHRLSLIEHVLRPGTVPPPASSEQRVAELVSELLALIEQHPELPIELKEALARVIARLK